MIIVWRNRNSSIFSLVVNNKYFNGAPSIYFDEEKMKNECQLLGFRLDLSYWEPASEEKHLRISQYVEWIRETVVKVIYMKNLAISDV
uniref:Uncharacterized protein n=1 Tax=Romanomermis culicivorax TaxID=13658 RepID=A0A915I1R5_ROMCU